MFLKYITTRRPWIVMKTAMTLDGKIAAYTGDSHWVTGEESRKKVQEMRSVLMGIMVGSGTGKADDPLLNCRLKGEVRQPVRIIVDSTAAIATDSQLVRTADRYRTLVAHTSRADAGKLVQLQQKGVETILCPGCDNRVDLQALTTKLGQAGIDSVLLEGGGELNEAFLRQGLVDEVYAFIAPKLIGGKDAKTPVEGKGIAWMKEAIALQSVSIEKVGKSVVLEVEARKVLADTRIGDSIATNGVCLTVVGKGNDGFSADVMPETMNRSNLGLLKPGDPVNLERALCLNSRLGGHLVAGHVDGTGKIVSKQQDENAIWLTVGAAPEILRYIVEKGSVAIDGVSLTIAYADEQVFKVSVIPHTQEETTLVKKEIGDVVNLENDMIVKYVEKLMGQGKPKGGLTLDFLVANGF